MMKLLIVVLLVSLAIQVCDCMKSAIVVGAGPSGLAAALVLSKRHGYDVTILEAAERTDVYDPTKAYPFLIRERGQKLTKLFPNVQKALEEKGIATEGATKIVAIPADPNEVLDPNPKEMTMVQRKGKNFWLRRHEFIGVLTDAALDEEKITIVNGASCKSVRAISDSVIEVCVEQGDQKAPVTRSYKTNLLVGSDGMKSAVRESLAQSPSVFPQWKNNRPKGFGIKRWFSPSSGLKFKTLHINSDAKVPTGDGGTYEIPFDTETFFTIRSVFKGPKDAISLGLLPSKKSPTRTFNVIRIPEHDIWKIRDGVELRKWFQQAFPRFDFSADSSLVEQAEFDRFAETEGLHLPPCQYSPELYVASPSGDAVVILVGDAVHTFPPDLGEGVNSGLEDVVVLDDIMSKHDNLGEAAKLYGLQRGIESKALVKMVRVGAPFQYNQFGGILTIKKFLWTANFLSRLLLNKLTFGLTPLPVFIQIADANLKYSTALRRANMLTASLWSITIFAFLKCFGLLSKINGLLAWA